MNRLQLQQLSKLRIAEARALLKLGHASGAYYLAGYAVECGLKAAIAKATRRHDFPDKAKAQKSWQHEINKLVTVAGLETSRDDLRSRDPDFAANWTLVVEWNEETRYAEWEQDKAEALIQAITHRQHGIMRWLTQHW